MKVNFSSNYSNIRFQGLFGFDGFLKKDKSSKASDLQNNSFSNVTDPFSSTQEERKRNIYDISPFAYDYPNLGFWVSGTSFEKSLMDKDLLSSQKKVYQALDRNRRIFDAHLEQDLKEKQELPLDTYFIRMKNYKKDLAWARDMVNLTYLASDMMNNDKNFDEILSTICLGVFYSNDKDTYGILKRSATKPSNVAFIVTPNRRGSEYYEKYKNKLKSQGITEFSPNACEFKRRAYVSKVSELGDGAVYIDYPRVPLRGPSNLDIVKEIYQDLKSKENPTKKEIVEAAAKMQWLIAQETPYQKGSDSVATILTRSIMHSYNVPISPLKEGISLDFEAFYSDLDEYVKNYPNCFEVNPLLGEE